MKIEVVEHTSPSSPPIELGVACVKRHSFVTDPPPLAVLAHRVGVDCHRDVNMIAVLVTSLA